MSTGDLLFIFAFIVLPTIILVSCIWTLLLIRAGVLLPERRHVQPVADGPTDEVVEDAVEDTAIATAVVAAPPAAMVAVEPEPEAAPVIVADAPIIDVPLAVPEPVIVNNDDANAVADSIPDAADEERFEQTSDLPVITDAMLAEANPPTAVEVPAEVVNAQVPMPPAEQPMPMPAPVADPPVATPIAEAPTPAPAPDLDVLFVPLPDDDAPGVVDAVAADEPVVDDAGADEEQDDQGGDTRGGRGRRKPVRRVAQLRPSEEQSSSISPMGNLMRRSRSGSPR